LLEDVQAVTLGISTVSIPNYRLKRSMDKRMEELIVRTTDAGMIEIAQPYTYAEEEPKVILHPDQVEILTRWLQEAKDAIARGKPS
jgi:hypothetical protein